MEHQHGWTRLGESEAEGLLTVRAVVMDSGLGLVLAGELDFGEVPALFREVRRTMQVWPSPRRLKLDLSRLRFVDLEGLRALAALCRQLEREAGRFSVVGPPRHVLRAMEISGVEIPNIRSGPQARRLAPEPVTEVGRSKRSRTTVLPDPDRSSTRSHN